MEAILQQFVDLELNGRDIIDILLVTFVLYEFVQILQGTLGAKMALGLAVVMVVSYISDSAQLSTMHWLFGNFWQIWVIALIILFQPEFRQALARVGQQSGFLGRGGISQQSAQQTVDEIIKAVTVMADSKIGALIVLEREMGLRTFREIGVPVDARVTNELVRCLFFPDNPLHDGAVIVAKDRIVSAACFLPLTKNPLIPSTMGSRHRAAMGITEETDAVAIVVSEETGTISVVVDGKMTRELYSSHLRQVLGTVYGLPSAAGEAAQRPQPVAKRNPAVEQTRPIPRMRG
jgi:diadenylate cyclase